MATSLVNQYISGSFDVIVQLSGSQLADGTGSVISSLDLTVSNATTASYALYAVSASYEIIEEVSSSYAQTASYADFAVTAASASHSEFADLAQSANTSNTAISASYSVTSSLPLLGFVDANEAGGFITFTRGDGTTEVIQVQVTGSVENAISASHALYAETAGAVAFANITGKPTLVSGSSQILLQSTTGDLSGSRIDGAVATATSAFSASYALNASTADLATLATNATSASHAVNADNSISASHSVSALSSSYSNTSTSASHAVQADSALAANTASYATVANELTAGNKTIQGTLTAEDGIVANQISAQAGGVDGPDITITPYIGGKVVVDLGLNVNGEVSASGGYIGDLTGNASTATSSSHALVSDTVSDVNIAYQNQNNSFTGTQTFDNIAVNGTGSFAYIQSVTGSAKIIGDAYIILNNNTPTERYAGIKVIDSGSAAVTASFLFDGLTNDWFYEYENGDGTNYGIVMFGPEYGTIGSPSYLSANRIPKADGGHHFNDSNISDDGTTIKLGSNAEITGSLGVSAGITANVTGDLTGNADTATSASYATFATTAGSAGSSTTAVSASYASNSSTSDLALTANTASFVSEAVVAKTNKNNTFGGIQGFASITSTSVTSTGNIQSTAGGITTTLTNQAGGYFEVVDTSQNNIGIGLDPSAYGASGWTGPGLWGNNPADAYPILIGFQNKSTWTDGRVTFLTPISASQGVIGNVTGNADTATSASHALVSDLALDANTATSASHALVSDLALNANTATSSSYASFATSASYAANAGDVSGTAVTGSTTTIVFDNAIGTVYGTATNPAVFSTGSLDATGFKLGASALIYHSGSVEPLFTGGTIDKKVGSYDVDALNVMTFVATGDGKYFQSIAGADVTGIITNSTDTYTTTAKVQHIITCTEAEYAAIGTPDANTFYIVTA